MRGIGRGISVAEASAGPGKSSQGSTGVGDTVGGAGLVGEAVVVGDSGRGREGGDGGGGGGGGLVGGGLWGVAATTSPRRPEPPASNPPTPALQADSQTKH